MRFLLAPAGSRGDFQPLLALAKGLENAGHRAVLASSPNFAPEAAAFGIEFHPVGMDVERFLRESALDMTPFRAAYELFRLAQTELAITVDGLLPLARQADVVVGGGAQLGAATAAEAAGVPYRFIAYTPQLLRSASHPPFVFPFLGAPRPVNRVLWSAFEASTRLLIGRPLAAKRRAMGLPAVKNLERHLLCTGETLLACDPEIAEVPPDLAIGHPPLGSFQLPDARALGPEVDAFLETGSPPVYFGFGSMTGTDAAEATRAIVGAAGEVGVRAILSAGWAGLGKGELGRDVRVVGPLSHATLFPRCAAVVHHGGAGTTHAAARAGVPQVVVPHAFDQFIHARWVRRAGIGPSGVARKRLSPHRLARALEYVLSDASCRARAAEVGTAMRARDGVANAVAILTAGRAET